MNNTFSEEQQLPMLTNIESPENSTCYDTDNNVGGIKDRKHTQFIVDEQAEPFSENATTRIVDGGGKEIYGPYFGEYMIYNCNTCSPKKPKVVGKCGQPNCRGIKPEVNAEAVCGKPTCSDKPPASSPGLEACEQAPCANNRKPGSNPICGQPQCVYKEPNECFDWTCEKKPHPEPVIEPPPPPPKRRSQMEILLQVPSYRLVEKAEDLPFAAFDLLGTALTLPWRTQLEGEDSSESDLTEGDLDYDVEPCFSSTSTSSKDDENMMSVTCNKCSNIIQLHSALLDNAALNTGNRCPIRIEEVPGIGTTDAKLFRIVLGSKKDNNSKPEINCKNKNCRFKDPDILKITVTPSKLEETPKFCEGAEPICGRVEKTADGEPAAEGEETAKGEPIAEGEETAEGQPNAEGGETAKGEPNSEGEETAEGEPDAEGEETAKAEPIAEGEEAAKAEPVAEGEETAKAEPVAEGEETADAKPTAEGGEPAGEAVSETKGEVEEAAPGSEAQTEDPSGLKISTLKTCLKAELGDQCREANKVSIQIGEDLNLTLVTNVGIQREEIPEEPPLQEELCVCPNLVGGENEVPEDLPTVEIVITASDVMMSNEQVRAPMKSVTWEEDNLVTDKVKKTDGCDCPGGKADSPSTGATPCKCARQGDQVCGPVGDELKMCTCKCQKETKVLVTPFLTVKKSSPKKSVSGVSIQTTEPQVQSTSCGCFGNSVEDLPSPEAQPMPPGPAKQSISPSMAAQPMPSCLASQPTPTCPSAQPMAPPSLAAQPNPPYPAAQPMSSCLASQPTPTCPSVQPMAPPSLAVQPNPPYPAAQPLPPCPALKPIPPCPASQPLPPVEQDTSGTASMDCFSPFLILNTPQTDDCICSNSPASKDEESEGMMKTALICIHINKDEPCACLSSTKATTEEPVVHISEHTDASTSCPTVCKPVTHSCAANILKSKESPSFHYKTNVGTLTRPMPPETIDKPDFSKMMAKAANKTVNADLPVNPCACSTVVSSPKPSVDNKTANAVLPVNPSTCSPVVSPPKPSASNKTVNADLPVSLCTCSPVVSPPKPSAPVIDPPHPPCPPPKPVDPCSCTSEASDPSTPTDPSAEQEEKTIPKFVYAEMPKENLDLHTTDFMDLAKALDCFMGCQKGEKSNK